MNKQNIINVVGICIMIVLILAIGAIYVDSGRVTTNHEPKFCIKTVSNNGEKVTYWGLGYKVIRYVGVSPNEPYGNNIGAKMGNWFMKYELPIDNEKNYDVNNVDNNVNKIEEIKTLDDFYNTELTKGRDIRDLSKEYNSFDAQKDNCFVIGAMVHNDNLYEEFMKKHENSKSAFIRVAQNTVEGDLILNDILYYKNTNKLYLVSDNTRDEFANEDERKIEIREYLGVTEYVYNDRTYWVLCNEEVTDENFNTSNVYVITAIN